MDKITSDPTKKIKNKKPLPVNLDYDPVLGAPIQDEILKRIGEQAKDWEETPRPARSETAVATARTAASERAAASTNETPATLLTAIPTTNPTTKKSSATPWLVMGIILALAAAGGATFWLNTRVMVLEQSLARSNAMVTELNEKIAQLQTAQTETQSQFQSITESFAAAATAMTTTARKPAAAAPAAGAGAGAVAKSAASGTPAVPAGKPADSKSSR